MKKEFVSCALVFLITVVGGSSWAQQQQMNVSAAQQSLEDAFLGANPEKIKETRGKTVSKEPVPPKPILTEAQRLERLMGVTASKGVKGADALKGPARAFVIAAYNTGTPVVSKASRISWEKISGVVTAGNNQPEIIVTSPGGVFDINGSSYILSESEQGIALTFVTNSRKSTVVIGTMEGTFITADGYVCRVKRNEEG